MIGMLQQRHILYGIPVCKIDAIDTQTAEHLLDLALLRNQLPGNTDIAVRIFDGCADGLCANASRKRLDDGLNYAAGDIDLRALGRVCLEASDHILAALFPE